LGPLLDLLRSRDELSHAFRDELADLLDPSVDSPVQYVPKYLHGGTPKPHARRMRDVGVYLFVNAHRHEHGGSLEAAYDALSGTLDLGAESLKKAYQRFNRSSRPRPPK
jgi:hypothetical protein